MSIPSLSSEALRAPVPIRRELLVLAAGIAFGVLVVPPLLWVVGSRALGPYAGGGVGALMGSFFRGLATGSFAFWMVALGPYLMTLVARALLGLLLGSRAGD